jgi:hypothetical protein
VIAPVPDQRVLTPDRAPGTGFTVTNAGNLARYWLAWIDFLRQPVFWRDIQRGFGQTRTDAYLRHPFALVAVSCVGRAAICHLCRLQTDKAGHRHGRQAIASR